MKTIAIIGSGNFGANAACFIAENRLGDVILVDSKDGLARGKALDLMEAAPVRGFDIQVEGSNSLEAIQGASVVVLAAGSSRRAGITEEALLEENLKVAEEILPKVKTLAPEAVLIIQREPVAGLVTRAVRNYGFHPRKVIGLSGLIETTRFRFAMAEALQASDQDTAAMVLGGTREKSVPLTQYANLSGIPLRDVLSEAQIAEVIQRSQAADEEVLSRLKLTAAYYEPAAVLTELLAAIVRGKRRYLPVSVMAEGQYGLKNVCVTLAGKVGPEGVEHILELPLTAEQMKAMKEAACAAARFDTVNV